MRTQKDNSLDVSATFTGNLESVHFVADDGSVIDARTVLLMISYGLAHVIYMPEVLPPTYPLGSFHIQSERFIVRLHSSE